MRLSFSIWNDLQDKVCNMINGWRDYIAEHVTFINCFKVNKVWSKRALIKVNMIANTPHKSGCYPSQFVYWNTDSHNRLPHVSSMQFKSANTSQNLVRNSIVIIIVIDLLSVRLKSRFPFIILNRAFLNLKYLWKDKEPCIKCLYIRMVYRKHTHFLRCTWLNKRELVFNKWHCNRFAETSIRSGWLLNYSIPQLDRCSAGPKLKPCLPSVWPFNQRLSSFQCSEAIYAVRGVNPYPIYDQNLRYFLPYLWPDQKYETLFMAWLLNQNVVSDQRQL